MKADPALHIAHVAHEIVVEYVRFGILVVKAEDLLGIGRGNDQPEERPGIFLIGMIFLPVARPNDKALPRAHAMAVVKARAGGAIVDDRAVSARRAEARDGGIVAPAHPVNADR